MCIDSRCALVLVHGSCCALVLNPIHVVHLFSHQFMFTCSHTWSMLCTCSHPWFTLCTCSRPWFICTCSHPRLMLGTCSHSWFMFTCSSPWFVLCTCPPLVHVHLFLPLIHAHLFLPLIHAHLFLPQIHVHFFLMMEKGGCGNFLQKIVNCIHIYWRKNVFKNVNYIFL
jgi:hypothetical protein